MSIMNCSRLIGFDSGLDVRDFANLGEDKEEPSKQSVILG